MRLNVDRIVGDRSSRKEAHGTHVKGHDRDAARKMSGNRTSSSDDSKRASHKTLLSHSSVGAFSRRSWLQYLNRYNADQRSLDHAGENAGPGKDFWSLLSLATTSGDSGHLSQQSWHHRLQASVQEGLSSLIGDGKPASFLERNGWMIAIGVGLCLCCCSSIALNNSQELDGSQRDGDGYDSYNSSGVEKQGSIGKRVKGKEKTTYNRIGTGINKLMGRKTSKEDKQERYAKGKAKSTYSIKNASSDGIHGDVDSSSDSDNEPALQASYGEEDSTPSSKAKKWRARFGFGKESQSN